MDNARLSPDGHTVAFTSPVGGVAQVFVMLISGGEPLQLTNDEGVKFLDTFSADGREVYYKRILGREEVWAVPTLGGAPRRVVSAFYVVPSADGDSIFYVKSSRPEIFRAGKSGLNEELVYSPKDNGLSFVPLLLFPGGNDILAAASSSDSRQSRFRFYRVNVTTHQAVDLGDMSGNLADVVWAEPGKTVLLSRTINGLTNIWNYRLKDMALTQITFGIGPDFSPMPDLGGKGTYFVNGKSSGFLTVYNVHSRESTDIAAENASEPGLSPDGKHVMYVTAPAKDRKELWVSSIDGRNKVKIATGEDLTTGTWAPDNFHLSFAETRAGAADKAYIVAADSSGLRQLPQTLDFIWGLSWSPDQKVIYVDGVKPDRMPTVWKVNVDGSNPEKFVDDCSLVTDADPGGRYLLGVLTQGEKTGIYEVSTSDRKCIAFVPGAVTFGAIFARDGKSFLYAVASRGEVTIYRQPWRDGVTIGAPQVALKVPFAFPLAYAGNAYDFSRDLSTIVYARPSGQADLYLLSQK